MTQFTLKLIALFAMLLDHTAKLVLRRSFLEPLMGALPADVLRTGMIAIGHMAFPIFSWFTAEGCRRTSDPGKYLLRLALFSALSEIPFQINFYGGLSLGFHNVIFTLLLAAAAILFTQWMLTRGFSGFLLEVPAISAVGLGWFLKTDYNGWGVGLVLLLYLMPDKPRRLIALSLWITVFRLVWHGWTGDTFIWLSSPWKPLSEWAGCMLSVPVLASYNGEKGRKGKWLFYWFYPVHLMVLWSVWHYCVPRLR